MLVGFADKNNSKIINIIFDRKVSKMWTWKLNTVKNVAVLEINQSEVTTG